MSTISGDVVRHPSAGGSGSTPALADQGAVKSFDDALLTQASPRLQEPSPETEIGGTPSSSSEAATKAADLIKDLPGVGAPPQERGTRDPATGDYIPPNNDAEGQLQRQLGDFVPPETQGGPVQLEVDSKAVARFQASVRTAYYENKLSTTDLADFVEAYTDVGVEFTGRDDFNQIGIETILGTKNTKLIKNVAAELFNRASKADPSLDANADEARRSDQYALAFRALNAAAEEGDTSHSGAILDRLSDNPDELRLAVAGALDASAPGALNFLVGQTTSRAKMGILEPDLADEVIQAILQSSRGGALLEQDTGARDDIIDYVSENFDRIVTEGVYPRSGTDSGTFPDRELNDDAFLEDIVATLMLNPGVDRGMAQKFADKFQKTLENALETTEDPSATVGERKVAAQTIGFVQTAYTEGVERAVASQDDYATAIAVVLTATVDTIIAPIDLPNRPIQTAIQKAIEGYAVQLRLGKTEEATEEFMEFLGTDLAERDGLLRETIDLRNLAKLLDPTEEGIDTAPNPDNEGGMSDLDIAVEIDESYRDGKGKAEDAREDLPLE